MKEPGAQGHWIRQGAVNANGYPYIGQDGRSLLASRVVYLGEYGSVPNRLRPTCGERLCVKPDHREPEAEVKRRAAASERPRARQKALSR